MTDRLLRSVEDAVRVLGARALREPVARGSFGSELLLSVLRLAVFRVAELRGLFARKRSRDDLAMRLRTSGERSLPWAVAPIALPFDERDLEAALDALQSIDETVSIDDLASVYESLIEREIVVAADASRVELRAVDRHERRSTGSYYTPPALVEHLLDRALEPALDAAALRGELERLTVCDPACGAGTFLVAAARRIARRFARGERPGEVMRAVISRSLYGVDRNPIAVELCAAALWFEGAEAGLDWRLPSGRIARGNTLIGATPAQIDAGLPDKAFTYFIGDDRAAVAALRRRNLGERDAHDTAEARGPADERLLADAWCAAILVNKTRDDRDLSITTGVLRAMRVDPSSVTATTRERVAQARETHGVFHWHLAFPSVFQGRGGFDVVLGNPPWIAHAGRASQRLPTGAQRFLVCVNPAFAGYRTTHGAFVYACASILARGGALGLILPTSVADLDGYRPVRDAHDRLCEVSGEIHGFGDGAFEGVFQPCMALVSTRRTVDARATSATWRLRRGDLDETSRCLLERLTALPTLPGAMFGERGVQTDSALRRLLLRDPTEAGDGAVVLREGKDIGEFRLGPPKLWARRGDLVGRIRELDAYRAVAVVVRQTARFPIAALSDGAAFRNTLLAAFASPPWSGAAIVALLNSSLLRWLHYTRFRDAREGMPQVKVGHLRALPRPPGDGVERVAAMGASLSARNDGLRATERVALDELVFDLYGLGDGERAIVRAWAVAHRVAGH